MLDVGNNVSGGWDGHLATAIADWNASSVLELTLVPGQAKGNCKGTDGRVEVCSNAYGFNGWLGIAQRLFDWTGGSVALTNPEMAELYYVVPDGVSVEIRA